MGLAPKLRRRLAVAALVVASVFGGAGLVSAFTPAAAGLPAAGQTLIFIKGDVDNKIRVQDGIVKRGVTDENGNFDNELYQGIKYAFGQYGWDQTVHVLPQKYVDWLIPGGAIDVKLDAILGQIATGDPAPIGAKVKQIKDLVS